MKLFVSVLTILFLSVTVTAQDTLITYQGVITADSTLKKSDLFNRGLQWVAQAYNSAQDVIQLQDRDGGKIILKGMFHYQQIVPLAKFNAQMHYTGILTFKDGRYKYEFTDFIPESAGIKYPAMTSGNVPNKQFTNAFGKKGWGATQETIKRKMMALANSLITSMKEPTNDNW